MFFDRGNHYEFLSLGQELAAPGQLQHPQTFPFNFKNVEKQYESYNGINVKLRYFVRVTVSRRMADVIREKDLWVYSYRMPPETVSLASWDTGSHVTNGGISQNSSIKMDVGIEDCLHIEFEYSKSKYHLSTSRRRPRNKEKSLILIHRGCYSRSNLLPSGSIKDQTHGAIHNTTRDDGCCTESI